MGKIINRLVIIAAVVSIISFVCLFFHAYNVFFPVDNGQLTLQTMWGDDLYYSRAVPSIFHLAFGSEVHYAFREINKVQTLREIVMQWDSFAWLKVLFFTHIAIMVASIAAFVICRDIEGAQTKRIVVICFAGGMIALSIFTAVLALCVPQIIGMSDATGKQALIDAFTGITDGCDPSLIEGVQTKVGAGPIAYAAVQGVVVLLYGTVVGLHFVEKFRKNKVVE